MIWFRRRTSASDGQTWEGYGDKRSWSPEKISFKHGTLLAGNFRQSFIVNKYETNQQRFILYMLQFVETDSDPDQIRRSEETSACQERLNAIKL